MSERKPEVIAVIGGQWGDEGKGKIVDYFAQNADVVGRGQGGDNAGHTVINNKGKFALHQIPSGIFNPGTLNVIGSGAVVNPASLLSEIEVLESQGISSENLFIDGRTHLVFRYHQLLDGHQENGRGRKCIGTTGKGIGPTYTDKAARVGLRAHLLTNPQRCLKELRHILAVKRQELPCFRKSDEFTSDYYEELINQAANRLKDRIVDTGEIISGHLDKGSRIVAEGAQGTLLDLDYGTYPYVTSSRTTVGGVLLGLEIPPQCLTRSVGVFKAYQSRVGEGAMPTELTDSQGQLIRERGHEYGTTTGRPRRIGFFDGFVAQYSQRLNHFTDVALTRLDILSGVGDLRINKAYTINGFVQGLLPLDNQELKSCEPWYSGEYFSWMEDICEIRDFRDLPTDAKAYCQAVMSYLPGANLSFIGVGSSRDALIKL